METLVPLDTTKHEIYNVKSIETPNVVLLDDENLLSSICSMICSRRDYTPTCIGFSSDVSANHSCTFYSEIDVDKNINTGPPMNITRTVYLK